MSKPAPKVKLRKAVQADVGFIFNAWLKSFKFSLFAKNITNTIFFTEHHKVIERLLKQNETIIACNPDDESQIFGFINAGNVDGILCVNYIYVKQSFRNLGIGKTLLESFRPDSESAAVYTHFTRMSEKLAPKYNFVYHPYLLINIKEKKNDSEK